jgi:hypothetical protein
VRHPATSGMLRHFRWAHLPADLQAYSRPFADLAEDLADRLPDSPELTACLRKLLEAKDCAVRARVDSYPE